MRSRYMQAEKYLAHIHQICLAKKVCLEEP